MRQLTCTSPGLLEWTEAPDPQRLGEHEALVRPLVVARCDIDLFLASGFFPCDSPFAIGHECVAEIVELGSAVTGLSVGQRVVVSFQWSCGSCPTCRRGHSANCDEMPVLSDYGMKPLTGGEYGGMLADLARVPFAEAMLQPVPDGIDPVALGSLCDNVVDGYRAVAPHLAETPSEEVLVVAHGLPSIPLYAVQAALALGAGQVHVASDDRALLADAERLGARPVFTDYAKRAGRFPIVVDAGLSPAGLRCAIASTRPEGVLHSVSFYAGADVPLPLGRLYTLGIRFAVGRAHSASMLPAVMGLVASGRLRPGEVTSRIAAWDEAPAAWLEPATKLVVTRA